MNKRVKFTHIAQKDFDNIKMLQSKGLSANQASLVTKRTHRVVSNIFKSETLEEYKSIAANFSKTQKQEKPLVAVTTLQEVVKQAQDGERVIMTNVSRFPSIMTLATFLNEMNDKGITVAVFPEKTEVK